ncbi:hypothetical protein Tsp_05415 [Trichinella spiralis]|uniref:hypothetical protein n=1 Tax=Trichinella spiralis TaxID=6334 RepID=UPI0001EFD55B|nr:hypothetical protein Tsp_05415 [Trichinella spiralis]
MQIKCFYFTAGQFMTVHEQLLTKYVLQFQFFYFDKIYIHIYPSAIDVFESSSLLRTRQAFGPRASASDKTAGRGFKYSIAKQLLFRDHFFALLIGQPLTLCD